MGILGRGEAAPGGWVSDQDLSDLRVWKGEMSWTTEHGPAKCDWLLGRTHRVGNALLPDGSRGDAEDVDLLTGLGWRRQVAGGGYVFGTAMIGDEDIVFVDADPQPDACRRSPNIELPDMERDMSDDRDLVAALRADDVLAGELYSALCNIRWRTAASDRPWSVSWRSAGEVVANLRGNGDIYVDWYCHGAEGTVTERIAFALARLGWRAMTLADEKSLREMTVQRITNLEALPIGEPAEWWTARETSRRAVFASLGRPEPEPREPANDYERVTRLAATGRIDEHEYRKLLACL